MKPIHLALVAGFILISGGLWFRYDGSTKAKTWLGYAEADYVRIGPPLSGRLVARFVNRGDEVAAGTILFAQDDVDERAALTEAEANVALAQEKLADMQGASRGSEIAQARADVSAHEAAYDRADREYHRNLAIVSTGAVTRETVDELRDDERSAEARLLSARAKLALLTESTGREHAIAAQRESVSSVVAQRDGAKWRLDQRLIRAPTSGRIADTYAEPGETLNAGAPVVELLPPQNIFVRFFLPEQELSALHVGDTVTVTCDSCSTNLTARISYVATEPEYTPPIIYSGNARSSLVFMVEAKPTTSAESLKPGQPVDVHPTVHG